LLFKKKECQTWSLYLVQTHSGTLYTGIATDVQRRFVEHQSQDKKSAKYLRGKGPLKLVFQQLIGTRSEASKAEYYIKRLSKSDKNKLILTGKM
jgi:putative endonuclease